MHAPLAVGFWATAFTVFALGLRHGADPDHLAAIDNLTRNAAGARRRASRLVGALFTAGHSIMVLTIAALAGLAGRRLANHGPALELAGTWASIAMLFIIGAINVAQLAKGKGVRFGGPKTALLPKPLRLATNPLAAIGVGALFGLGFDTSSQVAAYALAFTSGSGVFAAAIIGLIFSFGMAVTDTLDSLAIVELCTHRPQRSASTARTWTVTMTVFAFGIGSYELAQVLGWSSPVPDIAISALIVVALFTVFAWLLARGLSGMRLAQRADLGT